MWRIGGAPLRNLETQGIFSITNLETNTSQKNPEGGLKNDKNDFTAVVGNTLKRKWSKETDEMQAIKRVNIPSITTNNRYSVLQNLREIDQDENNTPAQHTPVTQRENKVTKKLPPLVMHGNVNDHQKFVALIRDIVKNKFHIKYQGDTVSVFLQNTMILKTSRRHGKRKD